MDIPKQKKGYLVDSTDYEAAIKAARLWQEQANQVSEESLNKELKEAFIDWGVAQGYINSLRRLKVISQEDYEFLAKKQLVIMERLKNLKEKR